MTAAPETRRRLFGELLLTSLCLLWGSSFVIIQHVERLLSPGALVFLRFAIAAALLSPFLRRGRALWAAGAELGLWLWAGFFTQAIGLQYTSAGRGAFITSLNVIFVPVLTALAGRRVGWLVWFAAAVALAGAWVLCYDGVPANVGDLWVLACALTFAVFIVRLESAAARFPALPLTAVQLLTVAVLSTWWMARQVEAGFGGAAWWGVAYLAVVCTALTTWLQTVGQRHVPAPQASIIFMLEPVFATAFAYLAIGERMGWRGAVGAALILGATAVSQVPLLRRR